MFEITASALIIAGIISILAGIIAMVWTKTAVYVMSVWFILLGVLAILYAIE
jgi:hypothetical protein